jgi:hypothetical protein
MPGVEEALVSRGVVALWVLLFSLGPCALLRLGLLAPTRTELAAGDRRATVPSPARFPQVGQAMTDITVLSASTAAPLRD